MLLCRSKILCLFSFVLICVLIYYSKVPYFSLNLNYNSNETQISKYKTEYEIHGYYMGRLGNNLFQFSSLLGIAHKNKRSLKFFNNCLLFDIFKIDPIWKPNINRVFENNWLNDENWGKFNERFFDLKDKKTFAIELFLQSFKYFESIEDYIKSQLVLKDDLNQFANDYLWSIKNKFNIEKKILVSIHLRRGDMVIINDLYTVADTNYLKKAIEYYNQLFNYHQIIFIVSSDDFKWTSYTFNDIFLNYSYHILEENMKFHNSFAILSKCNHSIITSGTFGWWGAYLAGGLVIYFNDFINEKSKLYKGYKKEDYYPPSWIGL